MFFIDYSQDILFLVLAFCALWLTAFLTVFIYYLVVAAKNLKRATQTAKHQLENLEKAFATFKDKLEHHFSYMSLLSEGVKKLADLVKDRTGKSDAGPGKK